jgi:hypothetical protein
MKDITNQNANIDETLNIYDNYGFILKDEITLEEFNNYCKSKFERSFGWPVKEINSKGIIFKIKIDESGEALLLAFTEGNLSDIKKYTLEEKINLIKKAVNKETFDTLKEEIYKTCENLEEWAEYGKYYNGRIFRFNENGEVLFHFAISFHHDQECRVPYESILVNMTETKGFKLLLDQSTKDCFETEKIYEELVGLVASSISFFLEYQRDIK